jgi:hypothetical protein
MKLHNRGGLLVNKPPSDSQENLSRSSQRPSRRKLALSCRNAPPARCTTRANRLVPLRLKKGTSHSDTPPKNPRMGGAALPLTRHQKLERCKPSKQAFSPVPPSPEDAGDRPTQCIESIPEKGLAGPSLPGMASPSGADSISH